jgi:hypothetical protein
MSFSLDTKASPHVVCLAVNEKPKIKALIVT